MSIPDIYKKSFYLVIITIGLILSLLAPILHFGNFVLFSGVTHEGHTIIYILFLAAGVILIISGSYDYLKSKK